MKTKRTSQYANEHGLPRLDSARFKHDANEHGLPRLDSARFKHGGGSTSNTKGEYVVLVCQNYYLPT